MNQDVLDLLEQYALYFIMILASTGSNCYYRRNCLHFFFLKWEIDALIISFETLKINWPNFLPFVPYACMDGKNINYTLITQ